jgi:DNA-binding LacI/PurR family transcriptional regulator
VLVSASFSHKRSEAKYLELLSSLNVDGVIFAGNFTSNPTLGRIMSSGMPVVVIDEAIDGLPPVDMVLVDDYAGAYHATTHLAALGHRSIALVTGPRTLHSVQERTRGYRDALKRVGINPAEQFSAAGEFDEEFGAAVLTHVLSSAHHPTAVFAASDSIALGMMKSARGLGVDIPHDLSIVGFDDAPGAGLVSPRLTTVRTSRDQMASNAVSLLAERLSDPSRETETRVVSVSLVEGDSATRLG